MNSLIVLPEECSSKDAAVLRGVRAAYARDTHGVEEGQTIKAGVLNGLRGEARVVSVTPDQVELSLTLTLEQRVPEPVDLIVGVPRPQTIKKVIQAAVMLGVQSLHLVRSDGGEKSYLQSRSLDDSEILDETIKALEQIWDTRAPAVTVHRSFDGFCKHTLPALAGSAPVMMLGDAEGKLLTISDRMGARDRLVLSIGPERGWSADERARFVSAGFRTVSLGARVLRVELALVSLLAQVRLLRQ